MFCAAAILAEQGVGEEVVPAFGERSPGLDLDSPFAHQGLVGAALVEGMGLDLVDRRGDLVVVDKVDEPVRVEVRDPDRPCAALLVEVLHGPPFAVVVPQRLVDQVEVEVVQAEAVQRGVEGTSGVVLHAARRCVLDPELGGDEEVLAGDPAGPDRGTHRRLVEVGGSGVQVPVARRQSGLGRCLGLLVRDLEDPEPDDRHADAVVEGDTVHDSADPSRRTASNVVLLQPANTLGQAGGSRRCDRDQQTLPVAKSSPLPWSG